MIITGTLYVSLNPGSWMPKYWLLSWIRGPFGKDHVIRICGWAWIQDDNDVDGWVTWFTGPLGKERYYTRKADSAKIRNITTRST